MQWSALENCLRWLEHELQEHQRWYGLYSHKNQRYCSHTLAAKEGQGTDLWKVDFSPEINSTNKLLKNHTATREAFGLGVECGMLSPFPKLEARWFRALLKSFCVGSGLGCTERIIETFLVMLRPRVSVFLIEFCSSLKWNVIIKPVKIITTLLSEFETSLPVQSHD